MQKFKRETEKWSSTHRLCAYSEGHDIFIKRRTFIHNNSIASAQVRIKNHTKRYRMHIEETREPRAAQSFAQHINIYVYILHIISQLARYYAFNGGGTHTASHKRHANHNATAGCTHVHIRGDSNPHRQ